MNQEIKKLWIEALRSGKYKQATGRLSKIDDNGVTRMCCLGVLCDLYTKHTGKGEWVDGEYVRQFAPSEGPNEANHPPREVILWASLETTRGMNGINLDSMNDGIGQPAHSFDEIATVIEEKF